MSNCTLLELELILKNLKNIFIYAEYLKNWLCDTGLLVSRGSRCCICCFCLPPVGGSVSLVEEYPNFFLDERLRNKTLLSTSKLSFWLGFWSSYLCRCVSAGGQVSVQWEHPWRHPHRDSCSAGGHKKYRELRHTGVVWKVDFINFIKDNISGMGWCWLGGRLGGLGGVGPSARGNAIPGEGGGTEVPFALIFHLTTFLLGQTELHTTIPTFCSWWGRRVHRWAKKTTFYRKEKNIFASGDDQGVLEYRKMTTNTCIRQVLFHSIQMINIINLQKHDCLAPINFNNHWRTDLGDGNVQKICLMPTFGLVRMFELWWILHLDFVFDILMVFWGVAMIKHLGNKICWMNDS